MPLSDQERQLFRANVADVKPLTCDQTEPFRVKRKVRVRRDDCAFADSTEDNRVDMLSDSIDWIDLDCGETISWLREGHENRWLKRLRQGYYPVQGQLDLHGLTIAQARDALKVALQAAHNDHLHCICIVHGKGYGSGSRGAVLKAKVNQWLRLRDDVRAFASAPAAQGGQGAVLVLLLPSRSR